QCDLGQPQCARCIKRKVECSYAGGLREREFVFRDHNEFAQRKSEIARGTRKASSRSPPKPGPAPEDNTPSSDEYPWLNELARSEIPPSLYNSLEQRAIDRFFLDWVLYPCNRGSSPGYMKELPRLYESADEDCVLRRAVEAMAFAAQKDRKGSDGVIFSTKAQNQYGAALARMQTKITSGEGGFADDGTLAGLLLIENFEMMYLARSGYVTAHRSAVKHFISNRGTEPLHLRESYGIWRTAHHRLQAYQILIRESPEAQQIAWVERLQIERPDLRISSDIMRMNMLCAQARTTSAQDDPNTKDQLIQSISDLLSNIDDWTSKINGIWRPKRTSIYDTLAQEFQTLHLADILDPTSAHQTPTTGQDVWLTYMWNFHFASQIALRESLMELLADSARTQDAARIEFERQVIRVLSGNIIASFPFLLAYSGDSDAYVQMQGKSVARFFVVLSIWNLQNSKWTPGEYKNVAREVSEFVTEGQRLV
ncbi:hypothetical protein M409DRAFT_37879, partial [Zasmidium cellare ATCC 36951]